MTYISRSGREYALYDADHPAPANLQLLPYERARPGIHPRAMYRTRKGTTRPLFAPDDLFDWVPIDDLLKSAKCYSRPLEPTLPTTEIYCDGAYARGIMGLGVYSECGIAVSLSEVGGTNNVAECLAAIAALKEAKSRGFAGVTLYSDSRLVVNWTSGSYAIRSATTRKYVPEIRKLLGEVGGEIRWIPGIRNPADAYSRVVFGEIPSTPANPSVENSLQYVALSPMGALRFRDFARLKSVRDQYSRVPLSRLKNLVPDHAEAAAAFIDEEKSFASCLRWVLRGLPLDKAIRKAQTDLVISRNATPETKGNHPR